MDYKIGLNTDFYEGFAIIGLSSKETKYTFEDLQDIVDKVAIKVGYVFSGTLTPTKIQVAGVNKGYKEDAVLIWTSIYPRFKVEKAKFRNDFIQFIGEILLEMHQERTAINFSDESLMIETKYCLKPDLN